MENNNENIAPVAKKGSNTNKLLLIVIFLLLGFCGYLIWQNMELQKMIEEGNIAYTEVSSEKDQLKVDLEDMLAQYEAMETNNEVLSAELEEEKSKIEDLLKKMKNKNWTIHKLKKETETLRTIMQGYVHTIDSLNTLNIVLREENTTVKTALSSEQGKNEELSKQNEGLSSQVTIASHLKALNLKSYGVKVKSNNTGKETDRAKRVNKIRTKFTIQENKITSPGNKWIYVRIITPDGKVLSEKTDDANKFDFNGVRGLFSSKKQINYQNQNIDVTIDWIKTEDFPVGDYNVEVYSDGVDIGKTKFFFK